MPASPDPVFGSEPLTLGVSLGIPVATVLVSVVVKRGTGRGVTAPIAIGIGAGYAAACLALWLGARVIASSQVLTAGGSSLAFLIGVGGAFLWAKATAPVWLYGRFHLFGPLFALAIVTTFVVYAFLGVHGETDPLALYVLFGPFLVAGILLVGVLEWTIRRLFGLTGASSGVRSR
ncbi:hypothetical protein [Natrarchaeobaculum aegyptiacum]|uniref:Uncharacterized protein n=1 Tax=Natrarchaeobaculum aegyptiacum TaxID=745377 RepID=A0A2Z2HW26_9EURY|nr:hypothetical protein [Natrarchaeobaculum aegyptiacum]ARS91441.1 hypothetical protein B1756_18090 [Natrarchaeobaculum aegyptiacum]